MKILAGTIKPSGAAMHVAVLTRGDKERIKSVRGVIRCQALIALVLLAVFGIWEAEIGISLMLGAIACVLGTLVLSIAIMRPLADPIGGSFISVFFFFIGLRFLVLCASLGVASYLASRWYGNIYSMYPLLGFAVTFSLSWVVLFAMPRLKVCQRLFTII